MIRTACLVLLLAIYPPLMALGAEDCETIQKAHEALERGSFEATRSLSISVNGKLKRRDVIRMHYSNGVLDAEILEEEILSKNIVIDGAGTDPALEITFSCDRLEAQGNDRWTLTSEDGAEVAVFQFDRSSSEKENQTGKPDKPALRPLSWSLQTRERFLFKKFRIEGQASYADFAWRDGS